MPTLITSPTIIEAAGNKPKIIREFIGRVNSSTKTISIAKMTSPAGWEEPGQTPEFVWFCLAGNFLLGIVSIYIFTKTAGEFKEMEV